MKQNETDILVFLEENLSKVDKKTPKRSKTMARKKKPKREPNITYRVKDMIKAMEFALEDYGNICVCNLILNCVPGSLNCCLYNKRDNIIYFKSFANKAEALASKTEDEVIVHGIEPKKESDDEMV